MRNPLRVYTYKIQTHTNGMSFRKSVKVVGDWKGITGKVACISPGFILEDVLTFGHGLDVTDVWFNSVQLLLRLEGTFDTCSYTYRS